MRRFRMAKCGLRIGLTALFILVLALALLVVPPAVEAQQAGKTYRIAFVTVPTRPPAPFFPNQEAFRQVLRDRGWIEGKNLAIETRTTELEKDLPEVFAQVVREKFDLIVTVNDQSALAAKGATTSIPIVMAISNDPVGSGIVSSLARPGVNVTGLTLMAAEIAGKRIEFLKEIVPGLRRVAAVYNPIYRTLPQTVDFVTQSEATARALGMTLQRAELEPSSMGADRWDAALAALKKGGVGALTVMEGPRFQLRASEIAAAALKHGLATVFPSRDQVEAGGLMSYGTDFTAMWRRAAHFADRILRGANPGDLPVEQPTKFDLIINLKTAKALGLTIPQSLLIRAEEVIQ
jgi:putative ABC transport system substrate-binding protein